VRKVRHAELNTSGHLATEYGGMVRRELRAGRMTHLEKVGAAADGSLNATLSW
jgi:hypothetical protein